MDTLLKDLEKELELRIKKYNEVKELCSFRFDKIGLESRITEYHTFQGIFSELSTIASEIETVQSHIDTIKLYLNV